MRSPRESTLNTLIETDLLWPSQHLREKGDGETALNSHPTSIEPGTEGPVVWAGQALTMALSHLLLPTWPLRSLIQCKP